MKLLPCLMLSPIFLVILLPNLAFSQLIIAHRGASHDAPENTLAAFKLAWKKGADAVEGDFHLTSDGQIVCVHDKDTQRVCPAEPSLKIAETDLATLRRLDVGSWKNSQFAKEKIPTLREVLATVPSGKKLFIEIKCGTEILPVLEKELQSSRLGTDQVVIISFKAEVIQQAHKSMPQYKANWLTSYKLKQAEDRSSWTPTQDQVLSTLRSTGATGLGSEVQEQIVTREFIESIVEAGFEFHAWTIDDPDIANQLNSLGVQSLTTNRPGYLRKQLACPKSANNSATEPSERQYHSPPTTKASRKKK